MRARIKRRERKKKLTYLTLATVALVLVILVAYYFTTMYQENSIIGTRVTAQNFQALYGIATSSSYGPVNTTIVQGVKAGTGSTYFSGTKPIVVYIASESCPYCAFMRWPLTIALMRFGNFSGLSYMQSSSTDIFASTDTFTFYGSTYSSPYIVFQPFENQTRSGQPLQDVPSTYWSVFRSFGGGFPFLNVANKYIVAGTLYYPSYLGSGSSGNWTKDIQSIGNSGTKLSYQVMSAANLITALICRETGGMPTSICSNASVTGYASISGIAAYVSSPSATLIAGSTNTSAITWSTVQYMQISPKTKSSA